MGISHLHSFNENTVKKILILINLGKLNFFHLLSF